ncbi:MAG: OprD family outer membrane porin [Gammaproteobacteria bacterium]|nr:OprD family outer membrane porin [Gammaproteobacteria bacterium]
MCKHVFSHWLPAMLAAAVTLFASASYADSLTDFLSQGTYNGYFREYYFTRNYTADTAPFNQKANDFGGMFNYLSPTFGGGFSAGGTFWAAQDIFGLNNDTQNYAHLDTTLAGTQPIYTLGQAYLQWKNDMVLIRGGNQLLSTPWMGASDSRMVPATYQGLLVDFTLTKGLDLVLAREFRWKSRTSSTFSATTLYNANGFEDIYGGSPNANVGTQTNNGTAAAGLTYKAAGLSAEAWYYDFYDLTTAAYGNASYVFNTGGGIAPVIGAQYLHESHGSDNLLQSSVSNSTYGAMAGIQFSTDSLVASYNHISASNSDFRNGGIVSPYSAGYATDPLYTTSMTAGLVEKGVGNAWKLAGTFYFVDKQLRLIAGYARYNTEPYFADTNETDIDVTWFFSGNLKGLSLRNRLGIVHGLNGSYGAPNLGTFYYNRLMVQYDF